MKTYTLIKESRPGFIMQTAHLEVVRHILDVHVCNMCKGLDPDHSADMDLKKYNTDLELLREEKKKDNPSKQVMDNLEMELINQLLFTGCGMEFEFGEEDHD